MRMTFALLTAAMLSMSVHAVKIASQDWVTNKISQAVSNISSQVDFSSGNTQLVATIEATAPAPGNYAAVSNAAMNARSMTDLGVRGAPEGEGSWFVVGSEMFQFSAADQRWEGYNIEGHLVTISKTQGGYYIYDEVSTDGYSFSLDEKYSFVGYGLSIIGYTNTLALVSQIPVVPTPPSVFYDSAGGEASISGATLTYQAASNSVGSAALLAGTNVLHLVVPAAISGHVRDFGLTVATEDAATITLDTSVSWRFDAASTNLEAGSWSRIYCTESPAGVFSLQLWTPDSIQEATP